MLFFVLGVFCATLIFIGIFANRIVEPIVHQIAVKQGWVTLPSGWSREFPTKVRGYVMPATEGYYWWVERRGRYVMEGPAPTLPAAQKEVETLVAELRA